MGLLLYSENAGIIFIAPFKLIILGTNGLIQLSRPCDCKNNHVPFIKMSSELAALHNSSSLLSKLRCPKRQKEIKITKIKIHLAPLRDTFSRCLHNKSTQKNEEDKFRFFKHSSNFKSFTCLTSIGSLGTTQLFRVFLNFYTIFYNFTSLKNATRCYRCDLLRHFKRTSVYFTGDTYSQPTNENNTQAKILS